MVLPKLVQFRHNLAQMMNSNLTYCEPLAQAIVNGLNRRYGSLLDLVMPDAKYAAVAAICNPKYKMRWVPPNNRESLRTLCNVLSVSVNLLCLQRNSDRVLMMMTMVSMKLPPTLSMPAALKLKFQRT